MGVLSSACGLALLLCAYGAADSDGGLCTGLPRRALTQAVAQAKATAQAEGGGVSIVQADADCSIFAENTTEYKECIGEPIPLAEDAGEEEPPADPSEAKAGAEAKATAKVD
eukprot:1152377-Pelagomonas_calceolata.AAC.1